MASESSVREFYKGRSILVTGGTGFMGKVLIEKMLYSIPELGNVYLLIRPKKGNSFKERLDDMLRSPMFDRIKNDRVEVLQKITPIEGDVLSEELGISSDDMETLCEHVSVVFHMAATVHMDNPLKRAVAMNTVGTKRVLDVSRKIKNLIMFVHVSTMFCYPDFKVLDEKFYRPSMEPCDVIQLCESLDEEQLALITPSLLKHQPNTYTYTKRLAETLVNDAYPDLPCVIARPSTGCGVTIPDPGQCNLCRNVRIKVVPAYSDPIPGWVDNLIGPMGLLLGAGKGVIRTMLCDASLNAHIIPVDGAINGIIALAMIESSKKIKPENIPIYNMDIEYYFPITWGEVLNIARKYNAKYPLSWPLWYPNGNLTTNYVEHEIKRILFHLVPAYIIDFLLLIAGQKRFMVRVQKKISLGLELLQYFTMREWCFRCPKFDAIHTTLSKEEDEIYLTYRPDGDAEVFILNGVQTVRKYLLKDDLENMTYKRMYHKFLYVLDTLVKTVFWCFVISLLAAWFEPVRYALSCAKPVVQYLPFLGAAVEQFDH